MSTLLDIPYQGEWVVVDDPTTGTGVYKKTTVLNFEAQSVTATFSTAKGITTMYTTVSPPSGASAKVKVKSTNYELANTGTGLVYDDTTPTVQQTLTKSMPIAPTTPPGGEGSDITGLVVFLALIIGFVVFLK